MNPQSKTKHALVTGAARGIGFATGMALLSDGCHVTFWVHQEKDIAPTRDRLSQFCSEAPGEAPGEASVECVDVRRIGDRNLEDIDVLVHNASAYAPYATVENSDREAEHLVLAVTLNAGLELARSVLPGMRARAFGRLIFVGSAAGTFGAAGQAAYAAANAGLQGLVRSLAVEAGPAGVTTNLVTPGLIQTERTREAVSDPARHAILARTAARREGQPGEVAALITFLASERASFINGALIPVDGGFGLGVVARENGGVSNAD